MHKRGNLLRGNQRVLTVSLLLATLAACQKNVEPKLDAAAAASTEQVSTQATGALIWSENADVSSFLSTYITKQAATSYGITASTEQVFNGTKSVRFELRDTDPESHSGTRAEIATPNATTNDLWYSYALYIPAAQYKPEADDEIITQWHGGGSATPALCVRTKSDHMYLRIMGDTWVDLGAIDHDKWHAYVYHMKHSSGSDGLIQIWRDGVKIMDRSGQNMYSLSLGSDYHLPQWKVGVYKSDWNDSKTTSTNLRVLYMDDIKYGNGTATYELMAPSGKTGSTTPTNPGDPGNTTPPTTPSNGLSVASFSLVNSATEKEVATISSGSTISLSSLSLTKANIRAVTSGTIANVKFELSGKQSLTATDAAAPYALQGDDGKGNYFYGNWAPPALGTYTLKATPYDSKGVAGTAKTITFTFVK